MARPHGTMSIVFNWKSVRDNRISSPSTVPFPYNSHPSKKSIPYHSLHLHFLSSHNSTIWKNIDTLYVSQFTVLTYTILDQIVPARQKHTMTSLPEAGKTYNSHILILSVLDRAYRSQHNGCKLNINDNSLIDCLRKHLSHESKEIKMILLHVRHRGGMKLTWEKKVRRERSKIRVLTSRSKWEERKIGIEDCLEGQFEKFLNWIHFVMKTITRSSLPSLLRKDSKCTLNTPSWSIPASSNPCWLTNFTRIVDRSSIEERRESCLNYPLLNTKE